MQQTRTGEAGSGTERKRVEAVVQALAGSQCRGESVAEVAHDARNMVTALGLYCDLLEEPGVLAEPFAHYGEELRLVASASRRLVEKLVALDAAPTISRPTQTSDFWRSERVPVDRWPARLATTIPTGGAGDERWDQVPAAPVANLAAELLATRNLLSALAGPAIALTLDVEGGARRPRITAEDLTRVLVNLVKNAVEAMPAGGRIQISLREQPRSDGPWLVLAVEDNGPGIPEEDLDRIFVSGYTRHAHESEGPSSHRGLGLTITRAIVEAAGGRAYAENRPKGGARLVLEMPAGA